LTASEDRKMEEARSEGILKDGHAPGGAEKSDRGIITSLARWRVLYEFLEPHLI
jgi:hypothetical protein